MPSHKEGHADNLPRTFSLLLSLSNGSLIITLTSLVAHLECLPNIGIALNLNKMAMSNKKIVYGSMMATAISTVMGFQAPASTVRGSTALGVAVDPTTVSKKDYEDICGVAFDDETLKQRLKATNYLYPKHVEVIEDIAPIAGELTDKIVSRLWLTAPLLCPFSSFEHLMSWCQLQALLCSCVC